MSKSHPLPGTPLTHNGSIRTLLRVRTTYFSFSESVCSIINVVADCIAMSQDSLFLVLWKIMGIATVNVKLIPNFNNVDRQPNTNDPIELPRER
jgi:hypothetical protein